MCGRGTEPPRRPRRPRAERGECGAGTGHRHPAPPAPSSGVGGVPGVPQRRRRGELRGCRGCLRGCDSWRDVWGPVLHGICGEQGMLREPCFMERCVGSKGCAPWRDVWGAADAPGAVLRGMCGEQGMPGGCAPWEEGCVGRRGCCRSCAPWKDVWGMGEGLGAVLGCVGCFGVRWEPWRFAVWSGTWNAVPRVVVQGMPRGL